MVATQVLLEIPPAILQGLQNGTYERIGGVIREVGSKQVVAWLRETGGSSVVPDLGGEIPGLGFVIKVAANFQLAEINRGVQQILGLTQLNTAIGLANLGISAVGFAVVDYKLKQIERKLSEIQSAISEISHKIDSTFYAKIKSAIDVAEIALKMSKSDNRKRVVTEVVQPLIEAQHYYRNQCDLDWEKRDGLLGREHLLILALAYITEATCYLELEENQIAIERLAEAAEVLQPRIKRYVETLMSDDPSGYLHPACKNVRLFDILEILGWISGEKDQGKIFDRYLRKAILNGQDIESWIDQLPQRSRNAALVHISPSLVGKDWSLLAYMPWNTAARKGAILSLMSQAYQVIAVVQSMIELDKRLSCYRIEIESFQRLGLTYREWRELIPPPTQPSGDSQIVMLLPKNATA